ncbi:hypothetical protein Gotur_011423 [Gossypium turneri]
MTCIKAALLGLSLTKLRGVFYDAEDVLDEFRCDPLRKELKTVRFPSISIPFAYSSRMGNKIKKINERLETSASDFKKFNLGENVQILQNRPCVVQSHGDTHSFMTFKLSYELEALNHQDSLFLLLKWAFKEGDEVQNPNILRIADEIVKKCIRVPLAVRTMGSLLYGKTYQHDWEQIRDNDIWKVDQ